MRGSSTDEVKEQEHKYIIFACLYIYISVLYIYKCLREVRLPVNRKASTFARQGGKRERKKDKKRRRIKVAKKRVRLYVDSKTSVFTRRYHSSICTIYVCMQAM
jgi:Na+/melibiose symporter-like transporter